MGEGEVTDQLLTRLDEADLDEEVAELVLAAALGQAELDDAIGGEAPERPQVADPEAVEPARTYLTQITVAGFRGIGPTATMTLPPGPGVTLVVGRNGSGKSTFAEAAELALSGETARWAGKSSVLWRAGWANAHHDGDRRITVRLHRDGHAGSTQVDRRWAPEADLDGAEATAQEPGGPVLPLAELGLDADLALRRPFLSYDELGGLWSETPSARHDRLNALLGLEDWSTVQKRLSDAAKQVRATVKGAEEQAEDLARRAGELDDERAERATAALRPRGGWDLDALEVLVTGTADPDPAVAALQALTSVRTPGIEQVLRLTGQLRSAEEEARRIAGSEGQRSAELADLLAAALNHHDHTESTTCPVCGTGDRLDRTWAEATRARIEELRQEARTFRDAQQGVERARRAASELVGAAPSALVSPPSELEAALPSLAGLVEAWARWSETPAALGALADHLDATVGDLVRAAERLRGDAEAELGRRQDRWRPLAEDLARWIPEGRGAEVRRPVEKRLKEGARWVRDEAGKVRAERFAPIAEQVREVWERLRQDSNVSVDDLALGGAATQRRLEVTVSVDDVPTDAGVALLSQGELHALSLALFLPRATPPDSPFRFVLIDDPVQAMDGSRVDGLARVLSDVGQARQVVVFTHDERLPDAFRSLGLEARVLEVRRDPGSQVHVREMLPPAERYLDDARALVRTEGYPVEARDRVVPGLCRRAVEATAVELGRRKRLAAGVPFDEVEGEVLALRKLRSHMAFALFGDATRHNDVDERLRSLVGGWAVATMIRLNQGSHEGIDADGLVADAQRLVEEMGRRVG